MYAMHIYIYIYQHMLMYKKKSCPYIFAPAPSLAVAGWDSCSWIEPTALLNRGLPSKNHHDHVLSGKRHHVALNGCFINFHALG
jgi:hypothetical protein